MRKIAYECLKEILINGAYSNLTLKALPASLRRQDRALITQLVYGTLQHYSFLSWQWQSLAKKKVEKKLEILINMSVYQLFYLDRIPAYAIVSEAVELAPKSQRKFVQAMLFACQRQGKKALEISDPIRRLAIECSLPEWIIQLWNSHYGFEKAERIARSLVRQERPLVGRVNPLKADLNKMKADPALTWLSDWALVSSTNLLDSDYFKRGEVVIQDISSQKAALLLSPKPNDIVLDACSAPGSKTGMIAAMMENRGRIVAGDLHAHRLALVDEMAQRLGATIIETKQLDASKADALFAPAEFDRILLDVPCSGLGVLQRKPELRWRIQPEDLDALCRLQQAILTSCAPLLKNGGTLVYSTCTLNKKENERQIRAFLADHPQWELLHEETCFPDEGDQDGFYLAKLLKNTDSVLK